MSKLFKAEQDLLNRELEVWYSAITQFRARRDSIFSDKGKMYDRESPVWERIHFPHGFVQEIRKKTDRVTQLLSTYESGKAGSVNWSFDDGVLEELADISNFCDMLGGLIAMVLREEAT